VHFSKYPPRAGLARELARAPGPAPRENAATSSDIALAARIEREPPPPPPASGGAPLEEQSARTESRESAEASRRRSAGQENKIMFVAYEVSRDLIIDLRTVVTAIERHDRDLADQLRRARQRDAKPGRGAPRRAATSRRSTRSRTAAQTRCAARSISSSRGAGSRKARAAFAKLDRLLGLLLLGLTHQ
jgi:hypothetical protein